MSVLTISGQIGAGARELGRLLADRLTFDYVDQEILVEAARTLGVPVESVVSHDERTAGLGERLATMLRRFLERSAAAGSTDPVMGSGGLDLVLARTYGEAAGLETAPDISDEQYISTLTAVVRDVAAHDSVVIIGRGSQVILRDTPGSMHVLLVGEPKNRATFLAERDGLSTEDAIKRLHSTEKGRIDFHHKFFKVEVNDPSLYHLTVNTSRYPFDAAAEIIAGVAGRPP